MIDVKEVRFDGSLVAAVVRDVATGTVLTVAWMNREALERTVETGETWFWSRSRKELWNKGATSGNRQKVHSIRLDCDSDALLIDVVPLGPACHTGAQSCFTDERRDMLDLSQLMRVIESRKVDRPSGSYTARLFELGTSAILRKVGEESLEVILSVRDESRARVVSEIADLVFHLSVLLTHEEIGWWEIGRELERRAGAR